MSKRIFIVYGHHDTKKCFNQEIRDTFISEAKKLGHQIDLINLHEEKPIPFKGQKMSNNALISYLGENKPDLITEITNFLTNKGGDFSGVTFATLGRGCELTMVYEKTDDVNYDDLEKKSYNDPGWLWNNVIKFSDLKFFKNYEKLLSSSKFSNSCKDICMDIFFSFFTKYLRELVLSL